MTPSQSSRKRIWVFPEHAGRWIGLGLVIAGIVIVFDMVTKWVVIREIGPGASRAHIQIAGDFVQLRYTQNSGIAFGLLDGHSTLAGVVVGIVIVPLVVYLMLAATRGPLAAIASGLILGGAAGNLIDRIGDESVTDFIAVGRWPSFNVADSAITVGALLLIALSLRSHEKTSVPSGDVT